jgi:TM2 domain-containing membrane protein YozV
MKKVLTLLSLVLFAAVLSTANATTSTTPQEARANLAAKVAADLPAAVADMSTDDVLNLTPAQYKKITGEKLTLKQTIALKSAQKMLKKKMNNVEDAAPVSGSKSQVVALILAILLGGLGIHRFYLGYTTIGIIQLLTLGGCGIWALIDLIMIITGDLKPADGSEYNPKL